MKKTGMLPGLAAIVLFSGMASNAHAGYIHSYSIDNPSGSAAGGDLTNISTSYNTNSEEFSWSYTVDDASNTSDGFWLVVSDGDNPKGDKKEYAILYGDLDNGHLFAYEYNGQNNSNSLVSPNNYLGYWHNPFTITSIASTNQKTVSFAIDATAINAVDNIGPDWDGIAFGDNVGIWFHAAKNTNATVNSNGQLAAFSYNSQGWHDSSNNETTKVPEPATPLLLAAGLLGIAGFKRKKKTSV